jgi:uncharacterized membrane protein
VRRTFRIVGTLVFVVLVTGGIAAAAIFFPTKEFSVPRVEVEATLAVDGTMKVVEHITYDFTGQFHYGTRPIPIGAYTISDVRVTENGQELTASGAPYNLQWFFTAQDEQRTFDISYTVTGAAIGTPDVAELYWKWVGEDHPTIGLVTATLHVPPGPDRLRAWGHGPLTGSVAVGADTVRWRAPDVPQGTFVEGRVAIPPARMPLLPITQPPRLQQILREEASWARAANDDRARAAEDASRERDARDALTVVVPILTLGGALAFFVLWRRFGKEPTPTQEVGEYVRDLPDDPPAVVDGLMHWGAIGPVGFSATILDLAQRGFLTVREVREDRTLLPDKVDYELTRTDADRAPLKGFERSALDQVFADGSPVMQSDIASNARSHQSASLSRWNDFKTDAASSLRGRRYINGRRSKPFLLNILAAVIVGLAGVGALSLRLWVIGGVAVAWAAIQIALTPLLRQRSPEGQVRYLQWRGVRNYLRDFSQLADAPVGHLVLWERYLVYAAALGVSEELAQGLAVHLPPEQRAAFAPWYVAHQPGSTASFGSIGSFASGLGASTGSFSPPSSSSGGGGGFSGGGGGGGGGGGIGAG